MEGLTQATLGQGNIQVAGLMLDDSVIPRDREFIGNNSGFLEAQAAAAH